MIKYHPTDEILCAFAAGQLTSSLSIAISAHIEMCPVCAKKIHSITEILAHNEFEGIVEPFTEDTKFHTSDTFKTMFHLIVSGQLQPSTSLEPTPKSTIQVRGKIFPLPRALGRYASVPWTNLGAVSRIRIPQNEEPVRGSLLYIAENGEIPSHTHKGTEIILLLEGNFEDEYDAYTPGDFMIFNVQHQHTPFTRNSCLCYTVNDAPLHFTQGINKLFNTFGKYIY